MNKENAVYNYDDLIKSLEKLNNDINKLYDIISVAKGGIRQAKMIPEINDFLKKVKKTDLDEDIINEGNRVAKIASQEVEDDFPFLNSQAIVMFYSYLESAIKDLIIAFLGIIY